MQMSAYAHDVARGSLHIQKQRTLRLQAMTLRMSICVLTQTIHSSLSLIGLVQLSGPTLCIPTHHQKELKLVCSAEQYHTHLEAALS